MKQKLLVISLTFVFLLLVLCWVLLPEQSDIIYDAGFEVFGFSGTYACYFGK
jgi:hypothetical protein